MLKRMVEDEIVSRIFMKHALRFDVAVSTGKVGPFRDYPYITVEDIVMALDRAGKLHQFLGMGETVSTMAQAKPFLLEFWSRYEINHGGHQVYQRARDGLLDLSLCVPVFLHGDEGTTYKKDGCFVMSVQPCTGLGTLSNKLGTVTAPSATEARMNYAGHAFLTRFLLGAALRAPQLHLVLRHHEARPTPRTPGIRTRASCLQT